MNRILIVEDKDSLRAVLRKTLEVEGFKIEEAADALEAQAKLRTGPFLMVLTDLKIPKGDGHLVLKSALAEDPLLPVVVMTAFGTVEDAVRAMKEGAFDFLAKPVDTAHLLVLIERAAGQRRLVAENILLKEEFAERFGMPRIVGNDDKLKALTEQVRRVAPTTATVLLFGESGTGKELFARALHELSPRSGRPFVAINCAAIPETLLENELFGHEKGAYTGANAAKAGKFEMADKGTLFLDEIGELSQNVQAKVLRVLQEKSFERVGGVTTLTVDVRLIAATNKDLHRAVADKTFREDLFFRLSVVPLTIPPLRERASDIPSLVEHFVARFSKDLKRRGVPKVSPAAMEALSACRWPGNVRELQNCIERSLILCDGDEIFPEHLHLAPIERVEPPPAPPDLTVPLPEAIERASREIEARYVREALKRANGDRTRAAEILRMTPRVLNARIRDLGVG
ncbi:MAG: sigma-54-dependent Fis family transcriptional regulator [Acidobacteria bacterium]|nr:sigma-54-dependent Fis family transcriptional regulator [Acidobacteriota bacterium]